MDKTAIKIVREYIDAHLDKSDSKPQFEVYTVWKAKALQNWKYLLSSTLYDGMYYEATYNGDKNEWYLDAYKKFENKTIPGTQDERNKFRPTQINASKALKALNERRASDE